MLIIYSTASYMARQDPVQFVPALTMPTTYLPPDFTFA